MRNLKVTTQIPKGSYTLATPFLNFRKIYL